MKPMEYYLMKTFFATAKRSEKEDIDSQLQTITHNAVIDGVMNFVGGLIAVLNENRQILAVNHSLLDMLGVDHPEQVLGLRPGEALDCRYADQMEAGCGTSPYCMTCGAAVAIVTSLVKDESVERECAMTVHRHGRLQDLFFHVVASPIAIEQEQFVMVFLHDRTHQQRLAALERAFFHDVKNTISSLLNAGELLSLASPEGCADMSEHIVSLSKRLNNEVELQRLLIQHDTSKMAVHHRRLPVDMIIADVQNGIELHPSSHGKHLSFNNHAIGTEVKTDLSMVSRVLDNMLINALEASGNHGEVILDAQIKDNQVVFSVWNDQYIPSDIQHRIFQRNFSTKNEIGRGLGTYSMKLIGETLLGGRVDFESTQGNGTRFYLNLPLDPSTFS